MVSCLSIWKSLSLEVENRWLWLKPYLRSHTKVDLEVWEITSIKRCLENFWAQLNSFPIKDHPIECLQHSEYIFKKRLHRNIRCWVMPNKYPKQNHMRLGETMGHISQISCCRNLIQEKLAEWNFWGLGEWRRLDVFLDRLFQHSSQSKKSSKSLLAATQWVWSCCALLCSTPLSMSMTQPGGAQNTEYVGAFFNEL